MFGFVFVVVTGRKANVELLRGQAVGFSIKARLPTHMLVITGSHSPGTSLGANSAGRRNQLKQLNSETGKLKVV